MIDFYHAAQCDDYYPTLALNDLIDLLGRYYHAGTENITSYIIIYLQQHDRQELTGQYLWLSRGYSTSYTAQHNRRRLTGQYLWLSRGYSTSYTEQRQKALHVLKWLIKRTYQDDRLAFASTDDFVFLCRWLRISYHRFPGVKIQQVGEMKLANRYYKKYRKDSEQIQHEVILLRVGDVTGISSDPLTIIGDYLRRVSYAERIR